MTDWVAVILAAGHSPDVSGRAAGLSRVAGLSIIARHVKNALFGGAGACRLIVSGDSDALVAEARSAWSRDEGFEVSEVPGDIAETGALQSAVREGDEALMLLFADVSVTRNLVQGLLQDGIEEVDAQVAVGEANRWDDDDLFHAPLGGAGNRFAGVALMKASLLRSMQEGRSLAEALWAQRESGRIRMRPMENSSTRHVRGPEDIRLAEKLQVRALRRNNDGLISQYLNRPVSLFLTRHLFLKTSLTPNAITVIAAIIGWAGIVLVWLWPGYWWVLLGAFLFHLSSVLDGCDGEIARLRFRFSRFGEWLDNVLDEINNALFIAAIGLGLWSSGANGIYAWAAAFYFLAIATCDSAAFYQLARWRGGSGNVDLFKWFFEKEERNPQADPTAFRPRRTLSVLLADLPRRDFYIFLLLVLAVSDALFLGFWLAVVTGVVLFCLGCLQWVHQIRGGPGRKQRLDGNAVV